MYGRRKPLPPSAACSKLTERRVELSIRVVTRPVPGIRPRVVIYVIIIVIAAALVDWAGQELATVISLIAGTGLVGGQLAPVLVERGPAGQPTGETDLPSLELL
jgi:hypothetical protein